MKILFNNIQIYAYKEADRSRKGNNTAVTRAATKEDDEAGKTSQLYGIEISDIMGRYIVARTDIPGGTILLEEDPLVIGPTQGTSPICIACYTPIEISSCARCKSCSWPLCRSNCEEIGKDFGHTKQECDILKQSKVQPTSENSLYNVLTPLRILLLKNQNENSWRTIASMEAHMQLRQKKEIWNNDQIIIDFFKGNAKLPQPSEDLIHSICGYIQVNGFGVQEKDLTALFPSAFLFSHDCTPNTTHVISSKFHMVLRSTTDIKKGDPITISYCNTLHGTLWRREQLQGSKFFDCTCRRCSDKTEFNTWLSAVKCEMCRHGYLLPTNPLDDSSQWKCDKCENCKQKQLIYNFVNRLLEESEGLTDKNVDEIEKYLKKQEAHLHPNHFVLLMIKIKLSQLYGKSYDCMIHKMSEEQLRRKIEVCKEIMEVFNVIEPGLSRIRGITLYEMHAPVLIIGTEVFKRNRNMKKFKETLKDVKNCLHEADIILRIEDPTSNEGLIGKAAAEAFKQMNS